MKMRLEYQPKAVFIGAVSGKHTSRLALPEGDNAYVDRVDVHVFICLVPCFPLHLVFAGRPVKKTRTASASPSERERAEWDKANVPDRFE